MMLKKTDHVRSSILIYLKAPVMENTRWYPILSLSLGANYAFIYSRWSRCSSAKGSGSGLSLGGPTKIKARNSSKNDESCHICIYRD